MGKIIRATDAEVQAALDAFDWTEQDALTDEDIAEQIASNPDAAPDLAFMLESGEW